MANEITAEMLARKAAEIGGGDLWNYPATQFLTLTRALASLQAERAVIAPMRLYDKASFEADYPPNDAQSTGIEYLGNTVTSEARDAPERVRCWMVEFANGSSGVTIEGDEADSWVRFGHTVTEGWFTAKGSTDD